MFKNTPKIFKNDRFTIAFTHEHIFKNIHTKKSQFFKKNSKNLRAIPCDARPFGNHVHTIPQSSRINTVDLILCSNLPQASLIGSFDPVALVNP